MSDPIVVGKPHDFVVRRDEPNLDRAMDVARDIAMSYFRIDDDGHSANGEFDRSTDSIDVEFLGVSSSYSVVGCEILYKFRASIMRNPDYDDDDDWADVDAE